MIYIHALIDFPRLNGETVEVGYVYSDGLNWEACVPYIRLNNKFAGRRSP